MATNSDSGASNRPQIIRLRNPELEARFNSVAPSTTQIRTARNSVVSTGCSQCFKQDKTDHIELRKCSRCKAVWYCSKECQKANWATHKNQCHDAERGISKVATAFLVNPILSCYLQVCLCLLFDLVNKPAPDTPFMARVDVGIEPSDITAFYSLYAGSRWYDNNEPEKIEGIFQINAVRPIAPEIVPHPHRLAAWRRIREELSAEGNASNPVVIVEFVSNNHRGAHSFPFAISSAALVIAKKKEPFEDSSAIHGKSLSPMTAASCLEFINTFIRTDKQNQLLLRMDMREEDREVIRAAGRGEKTQVVSILKDKMAREQSYRLYTKE